MINATESCNQFICLGIDDDEFVMTDGVTVAHRAAMHIDSKCPMQVKALVLNALYEGWIKPVAYMKESEYLMARLSRDER